MGKGFFLAMMFLAAAFFLFVKPEGAFSQPPLVPPMEGDKGGGFLDQGISDYRAENYEEALSSFHEARKQDPQSSVAAYYLGITYKQLQNYKEATTHLIDAIKLMPGVKDAFLDLGEAYYQLGLNEESLKQLILAEEQQVKPASTVFLKGIVLMKLEKNQEAVDSFNKAKTLDASMAQAANYQLGVLLIKEGKREDAGRVFKELVVADPNSDMAQFANQYLEALSRKPEEAKALKLSLGANLEYDDNVILKPSDQTLAAGISGEHDTRYVSLFRAEYAPAFSGQFGIKAQYSVYYSDYKKLGSYDVMSHTLSLVPGYTMADSMINLLLSYNYTWVDDNRYMWAGTASPQYTFMPWPGQMGQFALRYQKKELLKPPFTKNEDRDAQEYAASMGWFTFFAGNKGFVNLKYELNKEDTHGINWNYVGSKGNLNIIMPLNDVIKFNVSGEAYYQQYDPTNTNFLKRRRDTTWTGSTMLSYEFYKNMDARLQYIYTRADSNIGIYDYSKNVSGVGVEVRY